MRLFRSFSWSFLLLGFLLTTTSLNAQSTPPFSFTSDPRDTLGRQREWEEHLTKDPTLGRVPYERFAEERERIISQLQNGQLNQQDGIAGMTWQERGPSNAGGRTLAVMFDLNDPTYKKVWAGSQLGGLWYTNDITDADAVWTPVSDAWENITVSCLAVDPSNAQIMYAGTGDYYSSLAGGGIWKTTNGGKSWARLSATIPGGNDGTVSSSFRYIQRLIVTKSGHLFAATRFGVVRSTDGGASWQFMLAPSQAIGIAGVPTSSYYNDLVSSLEIGSDGVLFAAFPTLSPSRVYRSTNAAGSAWKDITPVNSSVARTELALAPSTSGSGQVVYAVSQAYNSVTYNQDIRWFQMSTNAGDTWSAVTIPTNSDGSHFTRGNGFRNISLAVDPTNTKTVFAGGSGWFRSVNGGQTWSTVLSNSTQQDLAFQPETTGKVVMARGDGVYWDTNWADENALSRTFISRNVGYRIGETNYLDVKEVPGSSYILGNTSGLGVSIIRTVGVSTAQSALFYTMTDNYGKLFIDEDQPTLQIFSNYNTWNLYDGSSNTPSLFSLSGWYTSNPAAYDSKDNVLYTAESSGNTDQIRRTTGIGSTPVSTNFTGAGYPYVFKLGSNRNNLFVGYANGLVVKYSNLSQTTPTATTVATGSQLAAYGIVSGIDVGASDNELLVTLSNYGVSSVWYTNNGGASWVNKEPAGSGLPDVPVRTGLFNPQNRRQVILGTDLGIWTTNDVTAATPGWTLSNTGMPLVKINQLRYRAADGRLLVATAGRGIFESNALAVPYTPSSIELTGISATTLCPGSTLTVSFTSSGPAVAAANTTYELWLSDVTGAFSAQQRKLGMGTGNSITVTLPAGYAALPYSTAYRVKVIASAVDVESEPSSQALSVGNLSRAQITDRRRAAWNTNQSANLCSGDQISLGVAAVSLDGANVPVTSYQWLLNGNLIPDANAATYLTGQPGAYQVRVGQVGCTTVLSTSYYVNTASSIDVSVQSRFGDRPQCDDTPVTLIASYAGEKATLQWTHNGTPVAGATSATFVASQSGRYTVQATREGCSLYASPLDLTLGRSLLAQLNLSSSGDSILCAGTTSGSVYMYPVNISYEQLGASSGGYSIRWYRDDRVAGEALSYFYADYPGAYRYELQQGSCRTRSNAVVVKAQATIQPAIRLSNPDRTICQGQTQTLYIEGTYRALQWQKDGADIPGATNTSYVAQSSGAYTVRVLKGSCTGTSTPVSLTFSNAVTPQVVVPSAEACSTIYATVADYADSKMQWYKNGALISGATGGLYGVTQEGYYSVRVTTGSCTGLSNPVLIRPNVLRKPVLNSTAINVCNNNAVRLSPADSWGTLQWKKDGVAIPGMTAANYYPTTSGRYTLEKTNTCGTIESDPVDIKIGEPTNAALTGTALASAGQPITVPVAFTGPAPWSFTLSNGQSVQNTYLNPYPLTVTPSATTTYSITNLLNACGTGTSSGQAQITVGSGKADLSVSSQVSSRLVNVNDVITYSLFVTNNGPQNAGDVVVTNRLPTGVEFVDASSPGISLADGAVRGAVGSVEAGNTVELKYRLRVTRPGTFLNAAQVAATNTPDPDSQPNSGTGDGQDDATSVDLRTIDGNDAVLASANPNQVPLFSVQGNQPAIARDSVELGLTLLSSDRVPQAGDVISLSLIVTNRGGATANSAVVQFELPAGWQLINNISGLDVNGQTVKAYLNPILANSRVVRVVDVQVQKVTDPVRAQILSVTEPVVNARPGNGYQNGERDEASLQIQVRN